MLSKYILILFLLLISVNGLFSQELKWRRLTNAPFHNTGRLDDIFFINENTGWVLNFYSAFPAYKSLVSKTTNGGATWQDFEIENFNAELRCMSFVDSLIGYIGCLRQNGTKIYKTINGGINWFPVLTGTSTDSMGICGINAIDENNVYATGRYYGPPKFYKSTNGGVNWSITNLQSYGIYRLIDCYFINKDSGFITGGTGLTVPSSKGIVLFTSDGGNTWINRHTTQNSSQWGWKIDFPSPDTGFISLERLTLTPRYFLKTVDGGGTWQESVYSDSLRNAQGIGFINNQTGWIGGYLHNGYSTTNGGLTWIYGGIGNEINRFRIINDTLAFASGDGVYKYSRDSTVNINIISSSIPSSFKLDQNYPNPFNPSTNIRFELPNKDYISIQIFNSTGTLISKLYEGILIEGVYVYTFIAENLPSGIYFYKIQYGTQSQTKKMILLK